MKIVKFNFLFLWSLILTVFISPQGICSSNKEPQLQNCYDDITGVKFLCDHGWEILEYEDTLLLVVSEHPAVSITISKTKTPIKFLGQIDRDHMAQIGGYKDGFQMEVVKLPKDKAIEVNAVSQKSPQARMQDFYILHEPYLYGILFSVEPSELWDNYRGLFQKVADSIQIEVMLDQDPSGKKTLKYFYRE